ncbi:MAG TPA: hypothetical protein VNH13_05995 [Candidatus Acidoferrales bacterium]|jgi:hypothetical protein|nr:hypothetical protein [Candidatus Acidoferrales bacterium]
MAYDPILTSFIAVGVVGGVAVVMNVSADWGLTHELAQATDNWTTPLVSRRYARDAKLFERRTKEVAVLRAHGYNPAYERGEGDLRQPVPVPVEDDLEPAQTPERTTVVVIYQRT